MGTRNLSLCKKDGEIVIAQYGQWDGYPEGQGKTILEFCHDKDNITRLKAELENIRDIYTLTEFLEEYEKLAPKWSNEPDNRTEQMEYWYKELSHRNIGGMIFSSIINVDKSKLPSVMNNLIYLQKYEDLEQTENYCDTWIEYAYLINFDTNELECYGGAKLIGCYDLDNLPTVVSFLKGLAEKEEEEEE